MRRAENNSVPLDVTQKCEQKQEQCHALKCELKDTHTITQADLWTADAKSVVLIVTALLLNGTLFPLWGDF